MTRHCTTLSLPCPPTMSVDRLLVDPSDQRPDRRLVVVSARSPVGGWSCLDSRRVAVPGGYVVVRPSPSTVDLVVRRSVRSAVRLSTSVSSVVDHPVGLRPIRSSSDPVDRRPVRSTTDLSLLVVGPPLSVGPDSVIHPVGCRRRPDRPCCPSALRPDVQHSGPIS